MMAWDVERLEVVIIVFNLGAFGNAVANMGEELLDTFQSTGDRVQSDDKVIVFGVDLFPSKIIVEEV